MGERIDKVSIQNFKAIRNLEFEARRVNLFIGEPNSGKSNILEALAFFSPSTFDVFSELLRFKDTSDFFFDQKISNSILIRAGSWKLSIKYQNGLFKGMLEPAVANPDRVLALVFDLDHSRLMDKKVQRQLTTDVRYYRFKATADMGSNAPPPLSAPFGDNLVSALLSDDQLRKHVGGIFREKGFRLQIKPTEHELLITKEVGDELYSYPWSSVSETLRRMVFLMAALETNRDATLLLDEPEANTFPFYTKYLAERIALDDSNQFFITTHNPYLLSSVVEKTPVQDLAVFVTRMENFETKVTKIPDSKLPELLELDSAAFFNLDRLTEA